MARRYGARAGSEVMGLGLDVQRLEFNNAGQVMCLADITEPERYPILSVDRCLGQRGDDFCCSTTVLSVSLSPGDPVKVQENSMFYVSFLKSFL